MVINRTLRGVFLYLKSLQKDQQFRSRYDTKITTVARYKFHFPETKIDKHIMDHKRNILMYILGV